MSSLIGATGSRLGSLLVLKHLLNMILLLENGRRLCNLLTENVPLDEIGKPHGQLVADELLCWYREDLWR